MTTATPYRVRRAHLPEDKPALLGFIMGIQHFERAFEPNRRLDDQVAEEHYAAITERVANKNGRILVAEGVDGGPVGWAVAHEAENEVFVHADEQIYGYIAELYVTENMRGRGIGRALITACEDWARERGLKTMMIGVLTGNARAHGAYRGAGYSDCATMLRKYLR